MNKTFSLIACFIMPIFCQNVFDEQEYKREYETLVRAWNQSVFQERVELHNACINLLNDMELALNFNQKN